jgi:hypothetical protein
MAETQSAASPQPEPAPAAATTAPATAAASPGAAHWQTPRYKSGYPRPVSEFSTNLRRRGSLRPLSFGGPIQVDVVMVP